MINNDKINWTIRKNQLFLNLEKRIMSFGFIKPDIIRFQSNLGAKLTFEETFIVDEKYEYLPFKCIESRKQLIINTSKVRLEIDIKSFSLKIYNQRGKYIVGTTPGRTLDFIGDNTIFRLDLKSEEKIYGLGQDPMGKLDHVGQERRMWNKTDKRRKSGNNGVPFYSSSNGYGLLMNTSWPSRFAIGFAEVADPPEPRSEFDEIDPNPDPWDWDLPNPENNPRDLAIILDHSKLDLFFICREDMDDIQNGYATLTGYAPLPPKWAMGFIQSKNRYRSMDELLAIAKKYRSKGIPLDSLVIDWMWFKEFGDLEWDKDYWTNPEAGLEALRDMGIHVMQAQHPFIDRESLKYNMMKSKGYLNHVPDYSRPTYDFSNPEARIHWWENEIKKLYKMGIRGYWTDMGELEDHLPGTKSYIGTRERVHNIYSNLWAKTLYNGQRKDFKERIFTLTRAIYTGIQKYGTAHWSNDIESSWEVLKDQVVIGQGVALSGQPYWCTDIGGFMTLGQFSPELYIRWFQWGTFCPIFRTHGTRADNEPWSFGEVAENIITSYIRLRYRLMPYIYSCARMSNQQGKPIMRAMCMDFSNDPIAVKQVNQYMFGPYILVAPVIGKGARVREIYLPEGLWYDFWTGEEYYGGQFIVIPTALDMIPLFVKEGAIIPTTDWMNFTREKPTDNIYLKVYPGKEGIFDLYEDNGVNYDYEKGEYTLTRINMDSSGKIQTEVIHYAEDIIPKDRKYHLEYPQLQKPEDIEISVDCNLEQDGHCTISVLVVNPFDEDVLVKASIPSIEGWKGNIRNNRSYVQKFHVFKGDFYPISEYLPIINKGFLEVMINYKDEIRIRKIPFRFGSGFASRFQLIGDFIYNEDAGIDTWTPVEENPNAVNYKWKDKKLYWYRNLGFEYNCMGYVYCWNNKIEEGPRPVSYGKCKIYSEVDRDVFIECSGDNAIKIWLNGEMIYSKNDIVILQVIPGIFKLKEGENYLLIKVAQNHPKPFSGREMGFSFRFVDITGKPIEDLLYSP